jgi:hypothetical protein
MAVITSFSGMRPARRFGLVFHGHLMACTMILGMAGLVAPAIDALRSPLSLLNGLDKPALVAHPSTHLSQLIRLTRAQRALVATQLASGSVQPAALARIDAEQQQVLHTLRTLSHGPSSALNVTDILALEAEWTALRLARSQAFAEPAALFARHSRLIDRQLELLSKVGSSAS